MNQKIKEGIQTESENLKHFSLPSFYPLTSNVRRAALDFQEIFQSSISPKAFPPFFAVTTLLVRLPKLQFLFLSSPKLHPSHNEKGAAKKANGAE